MKEYTSLKKIILLFQRSWENFFVFDNALSLIDV